MDRDVAQVFASHPSRASLERLIPVIEECQPILEAQGMDAVQQRLVDTGVAIVAAIAVTRGLLGWDNTPLAEARDIVCGSPARNTPPATE